MSSYGSVNFVTFLLRDCEIPVSNISPKAKYTVLTSVPIGKLKGCTANGFAVKFLTRSRNL
jgi:hypothetical protein